MNQEYIPVRLSHLLRHCSVGAIVRGPVYLMSVKDIRQWTARDGSPAGQAIPYVEQVRAALGIDQELREPPSAQALDTGQVDGVCVPVVRFPAWMRCSGCGLLHFKPWQDLPAGEQPRCREKDRKKCRNKPGLEQVPWVLVHADGHLADVPWHRLAHTEASGPEQKQCRSDWGEPYLRLIDKGTSRRSLRCERCRTQSAFDDSIHTPYGNTWRQPWISDPPEATDDLAVVLEINDARVHSPTTCSALVIPPESRIRKGSVVDRLYSSSRKRRDIERARTPLARKSAFKRIAGEFRCAVAEVEGALEEIRKGYPLYGKSITHGILLESEYQALIDEMPDVSDDEDFVTRHQTGVWKAMAGQLPEDAGSRRMVDAVSRLIAVSRLKEIMVFKGFQRKVGRDREKRKEPVLVPPDIIGQSAWLPALELYGEGIFLTLDEEMLRRWQTEQALCKRAESVERRFAATGLRFESELSVSPRFLLLHTLAHLLIRQLETQAGYPAASLKERIYCTAGGLAMAGILIYVAVPDVVGSLGGLAELAAPERFLPLLAGVFDHAEWCSLDPVCCEHEGQGPSLLNRAACHGCALVPEPSCAYGNVLLDRVFIKGDEAAGIPAVLDYLD